MSEKATYLISIKVFLETEKYISKGSPFSFRGIQERVPGKSSGLHCRSTGWFAVVFIQQVDPQKNSMVFVPQRLLTLLNVTLVVCWFVDVSAPTELYRD